MGKFHELVSARSTPPQDPVVVPPVVAGQATLMFTAAEPLEDYGKILNLAGLDPEKVEIVGDVTFGANELASGETKYRFGAKIREKVQPVDVDDIAWRVMEAEPSNVESDSEGPWLVFQAGDLQLGKRSSGGSTDEILERYFESVETVRGWLIDNGYRVSGVQVSMPGDLCEGNQSQGGKNVWLTQETITEQTRLLRRVMFHTIERLAPETGHLYLDVVSGNHDEAERRWNTYPGDGWATEAAISVSDALKLNDAAYGHVEVRVPDKWYGYMTNPVGDTLVTVVHGHQFGRLENAFKWWQEQAFGGHNPKDAQIMQHGHFHTMSIARDGDRTRVCAPTYDCGSDWHREKHGSGNLRGGLMYLLKSGEISEMSFV